MKKQKGLRADDGHGDLFMMSRMTTGCGDVNQSLEAERREDFFFGVSATGSCSWIPARAASIMIRPQYSHTSTFLWVLISS